jgi:hypothetical protein
MNQISFYVSCVFFALGMAGCAQMDQVQPVKTSQSRFVDAVYKGATTVISENKDGLEEFRVFHQARSGFHEVNEVQASATAEAVRFCAMRNMRAVFFEKLFRRPLTFSVISQEQKSFLVVSNINCCAHIASRKIV